LFKHLGIIVATCAFLAAIAVNSALAATTKPVAVYFRGDPWCVRSNERASYPLVAQNLSNEPQRLTVRVMEVSKESSLHGVALAKGTSHLEGPAGFAHWTIQLQPGQSVTKRIVAVIPDVSRMQKGPLAYSITVMVYAGSGLDTFEFPATAMAPYCA
jgi:hypothetical protein